jgi:hypothetical protein
LSRHEQAVLEQPWQAVREGVQVKLLAQEGAWLVLAQSKDRVNTERSRRRRQLKGLWKRLKEWAQMELSRDPLLLKLGGGLASISGGLALGRGGHARGEPAHRAAQFLF